MGILLLINHENLAYYITTSGGDRIAISETIRASVITLIQEKIDMERYVHTSYSYDVCMGTFYTCY